MKIKTVLKILREISYMKSVLRRFGDSLARGKYHQHDSFRAFSLDEPYTGEMAKLYFDRNDKKGRMASVANTLNKIGFFKNKNKRSAEDYEAFYTSNNFDKIRETKLFSFKRRKILTVCTTFEEMSRQINLYNELSRSYNMPNVIKCDRYENSIEVSMVNLLRTENEIAALTCIVNSTVANNPAVSNLKFISPEPMLNIRYEDEEMNGILRKIKNRISPSVIDIQIPHCTQHGDLAKDNLLYGECDGKIDFWWIDWEHKGERPFFYDYFFYIVHSAFYYGKWEAFECYINGDLDATMERFFAHFGLNYEKQCRFDYIMLYLIYFLNERVCPITGISTLKKYYETVETMEAKLK